MKKPVRILIVEDQPHDADLAKHEIRKVLRDCEFLVVETRESFIQALDMFQPDVVLSDYRLPHFDGMKALKLTRRHAPSTPLIICTGSISEDAAVDCIKAGANNYILKDNLKRLGPSILHALEGKEMLAAQKTAEQKYQSIFENSMDGIFQSSPKGRYISVNPAMARLYGYDSPAEMVESVGSIADRIYVNPAERTEFMRRLNSQNTIEHYEQRNYRRDGSIIWTSTSARAVRDENGMLLYYEGFIQDITQRKKAEEALQNNERRFRALIENGLDDISLLAADGSLLWESPSTIRNLGYAPGEFVGRNIFEMMHPEDLEWTRETFATLLQEPGSRQRGIFRLRRADATWRWVEAIVSNMLEEPGLNAIVVNYRDITDRKQAEEALRENQTRYQNLVETSHDLIWTIDAQGRFTFVNRAAREIYGYEPEELIGRSFFELLDPQYYGPQDFEKFQEAIAQANAFNGLETYVRHRDGRQIILSANSIVLRDAQGNITGVAGSSHDITARKRVEDVFREERNLLRTLIDNIPDRIYAMDRQGRKTLSNLADWKACSVATMEDVIGKTDFDQYPPEIAEEYWKLDQAVLHSGQPVINYEERGLNSSGDPVSILTSKIPLRDDEGNVIGLVGIGRDITERIQTEENLRRSEARYRLVTKATNDVIWEWDPKTDQLLWSESAQHVFGYPAQEIEPNDKWWDDRLHPEDRTRVLTKLDDLIAGSGTIWLEEYRFLLKDGSYAHISDRGYIERDEHGAPIRVIGAMSDVTERKQAEDKLRESENRLILALSGAQMSVWEWDLQTNQIFWSPEFFEITGVKEDEFGGTFQSLTNLIHAEDVRRVMDSAEKAMQEQSLFAEEFRILRPDGEIRWLSNLGHAEYDSAGTHLRLIGTVQDITQRKQAEIERQALLEIMQGFANTKDLHELLKLIHDAIARVVYAENFFVILYQPATGLFEEIYSVDQYDPPALPARLEDSITSYVFRSGEPLLLTQASFEELAAQGKVKLVGVDSASWLGVPLKSSGRTIGVLAVQDYENDNRYSEHDRDFLASIASQVALAIEHKQSEAAEHEQRILAEALRDTAETLSRTLDYGDVLDHILTAVGRVVPHDAGSILLVEGEFARVVRSVGYDKHGFSNPEILGIKLPLANTTNLRHMFETRQSEVIYDTHEYPGWQRIPSTDWLRSSVGAPILIYEEVIGFICLDSRTIKYFTPIHAERLEAFANQAALAIQNARLLQQAQAEIAERKRAEESLHRSEALYRQAIEVAGAVPYYQSYYNEGKSIKYEFIGEGIRQITGYGTEEFSARLWDSLVEEINLVDDLAGYPLEEAIHRVRTGKNPIWKCEHRIRDQAGNIHWVFEAAVELRDENGVSYGSIGTYQDITQRKQAEQALREREEQYRTIFEGVQDAIFVESLDGKILMVNERACEMFGYTQAEFLTRAVSDLVPPHETILAADGEDISLYVEPRETFNQRANGEVFPIEISGRVQVINGEHILLVVVRDITERKRAEAEIRRRAEETAALLETSMALTNLDLEAMLQTIGSAASSLFLADGCRIFLLEEDGETLRCVLALGENTDAFLNLSVKIGQGVTGAVAASGKAEIVNEMLTDPRATQVAGTQEEQEAIMFGPLKQGDQTIGILSIRRTGGNQPFQQADLELLEAFASMAASTVSRARLFEETQRRLTELRASEERFRQLADNIQESFWMTDAQTGKELYMSPAVENIWGRPVDYLMNEPDAFIKSVYPEDLPIFMHAIEREKNGEKVESEYRVMRPDGSLRWIWDRAFPIFDDSHQVTKIAGISADITDRRESELALLQSQNRYRELFDSSPVSIWEEDFSLVKGKVDALLKSGVTDLKDYFISHPQEAIEIAALVRITDANQTSLDLYRVKRKEDLLRSLPEAMSKDTLEHFQEEIIGLLSTPNKFTWEGTDMLQNGTQMEVVVTGSIPHGYEEDWSKVIVSISDITQRKQSETEIRRHIAELEAVYENGLSVGRLLEPGEIGNRLIETFARYLPWHHVTIRLRKEHSDDLELVAFNLPNLREEEKSDAEQHFVARINKVGHGLSGWAIQTGQPLRTGNVHTHPQYIDTHTGIQSGLYIPLKAGERVIGVISVESEAPDAFTEQDERLLATLANQTAIAFENARLYEAMQTELLERKRVEEALRLSGTHYRALADSITDILFELDQDLCYTHWNKASEALTGIPAREAIGTSMQEVPGISEEQTRLKMIYEDVLKTQQPRTFETTLVFQGAKRFFETTAYPSLRGVSVVAKDVTDRKWTETIMQKRFELMEYSARHSLNELTLQTVDEVSDLTGSAIGFFHFMDEDQVNLGMQTWSTNALQLFQVAPEGGTHLPLNQAGVWAEAVRQRRPLIHNDYESLANKKDLPPGHVPIAREIVIPIIRNERIMAVMGIANKPQDYTSHDLEIAARLADYAWDITERKQMEIALQLERNQLVERVEERTADLSRANSNLARALRVKDEFLANMSHELRTPLNAILGLSESLGEQIAGPLNEKQQKYISTISESGHHLLALINDILDLAKIDAGQITLDINKVDIHSVCHASLRMIKQLAQKKNQEVFLKIDPDLGVIWADERRLKQMIVNLLGNAVKFTPEYGKLGLDVQGNEAANQVAVTVWDNGIGISQNDLARLFQPFVQLDSGLAREATGTGLGLALVAQMARLHGGSVSAISEAEKGSRFTILLPWEPALAMDTASRMRITGKFRAIQSDETNKQSILLVEDTKEVVMMLKDYLERSGYKVFTAQDGIDGVVQAQHVRPDLILMDVQMPGMDGFETTRKLRSDPNFRYTPIIALTALAMPHDRERCLEAGMDEYISKPVNLKALVKIIQSCLLEQESRAR